MKNHEKKLFYWSTILSIIFSVLAVPGVFSISASAITNIDFGDHCQAPQAVSTFICTLEENISKEELSLYTDPTTSYNLIVSDGSYNRTFDLIGESYFTFFGSPPPVEFYLSNQDSKVANFRVVLDIYGNASCHANLAEHPLSPCIAPSPTPTPTPYSAASSLSGGLFSFLTAIISFL